MAHGGNVITELMADHREVEELFAQIEAQPVDHPRRRELADRLTAELVRHSMAEEMHLYPVVREHVDAGGALADRELAEHAGVEQMLKDLETLHAHDPRFNDIVAKLKFEVVGHAREEERELFPRLAGACSRERLDELGRLVRRAREKAPTRPHPFLPGAAPAKTLLTPGAGLVDRIRDLLNGRTPHR